MIRGRMPRLFSCYFHAGFRIKIEQRSKMIDKKVAFIYSDTYLSYDYGPSHPLKMIRLKLTYELLKSFNIFDSPDVNLIEPVPASEETVMLVHREEYINALKEANEGVYSSDLFRYGLGWGDNPVFRGVYSGSLLSTGASIQAVRLVGNNKVQTAFNIAGGLHHAMPERASGFCYINDPAVAVAEVVNKGKRVVYVDIDAHHGDGVQHVFYRTDRVLTISLHESGDFLFPGTGKPAEIGEEKGRGYSVNIPFYPDTGDDVFLWAFEEIVPPLIKAFNPDILVTQLGADALEGDPLTHMRLTNNAFCRAVEIFRSLDYPWVALGGGGYNVLNVARAWALAFGIMCGVELPDEFPSSFKEYALEKRLNFSDILTLRDKPSEVQSNDKARSIAASSVEYIRRNVFPIHGL
ncbi:MAG: acetoin utilization protein AcuC [Nitrospirota bacterium]